MMILHRLCPSRRRADTPRAGHLAGCHHNPVGSKDNWSDGPGNGRRGFLGGPAERRGERNWIWVEDITSGKVIAGEKPPYDKANGKDPALPSEQRKSAEQPYCPLLAEAVEKLR